MAARRKVHATVAVARSDSALERSMNTTFDDLLALVELMGAFPVPWFFAGGWAIDLLAGRVTRQHEDLEISIDRADQDAIHPHAGRWRVEKIMPGEGEAGIVVWKR